VARGGLYFIEDMQVLRLRFGLGLGLEFGLGLGGGIRVEAWLRVGVKAWSLLFIEGMQALRMILP